MPDLEQILLNPRVADKKVCLLGYILIDIFFLCFSHRCFRLISLVLQELIEKERAFC